jgi:predicted transcriptional regulator
MDMDKMLSMWDTDEPQAKPALLSTTGRVLFMMMVNPKITQITMSILFNVSETAIEKAVANLINAGIVGSVKNGRKNEYSINWEVIELHNDFQMMKEIFHNDVQKRFTNP